MSTIKTYFLITLCILFWSMNFVIGRFIKDDITPLELAFFRWLFVFIMVSPILILRYEKILYSFKNNYKILTILAILGITVFNTLLYSGLNVTTATNALIINSTVPILVLLLSYFILKQNINLYQTAGIIVSTLGVMFIIFKADISNILLVEFNQGDMLIIIASITWALYSVLVKFKPKDLSDLEYFSTIVTIGLILLLPFYLYQGYSIEREVKVLTNNFLIFLYVSVFASLISYYLWHYGINNIGASKTAQFTHLMPVFGIGIASIFLDETLKGYHLLGAILIIFGIYLSLFHKRK